MSTSPASPAGGTTPAALWSVFTKPWPHHSGAQIGRLVSEIGLTGVEVPVRNNTYLTPANASVELPRFTNELAGFGVGAVSVAAELSEPMFHACAEAGVPLIRVMAQVFEDDYSRSVALFRGQLEQAVPWTRNYGVQVGIQPHHGDYVSSVVGVMALLEGLPPEHFRVIWDAVHDALAGDAPETTLPMVADRLAMVNLKNVIYERIPGTADSPTGAAWDTVYVPANAGLAHWGRVLAAVQRLGGQVPICLSAQYSTAAPAEELLVRDVAFAQRLWAAGLAAEI
ncbi:sugar phosphate isomerase/epimerase family protein [Arthrobacter sp. HLT1-20]